MEICKNPYIRIEYLYKLLFNLISMNKERFSHVIETNGDGNSFSLVSDTGACVGKILFTERDGKTGKIYDISRLATTNWGDEIDKLGLTWIEKTPERIPGLLYIMFKVFIEYIQSIDSETFSLNIEKPLFHLESIYRKLYRHLLEESYIDSGVVNKNMAVFRCEQ